MIQDIVLLPPWNEPLDIHVVLKRWKIKLTHLGLLDVVKELNEEFSPGQCLGVIPLDNVMSLYGKVMKNTMLFLIRAANAFTLHNAVFHARPFFQSPLSLLNHLGMKYSLLRSELIGSWDQFFCNETFSH